MNKKSVSAIYVRDSKNSKLSRFGRGVDVTYASTKASCSNKCPWFEAGCYALTGRVGMVNNKLNDNASPHEVTLDEVSSINESWGGEKIPQGQCLRLHVSGDCKNSKDVEFLASACNNWIKRGGDKVWSYTHFWRKVPRKSWGKVSILASVESYKDAKLAIKKSYAPAIVVPKFPNNKKSFVKNEIKFIPCPAQTFEKVTCLDCRLCFDVDKLLERNCGIAFESHGVQKNSINKKLKVLQG